MDQAAAFSRSNHACGKGLGTDQRSCEIDLQHAIPRIQRQLHQWLPVPYGSVVHQDPARSKFPLDLTRSSKDAIRAADVSAHVDRSSAICLDR